MRVAFVHYWLVSMRGGEQVLEALSDLYPQADIFTLVYDEKKISEKLKRHKIIPSFLQRIPGAVSHYKKLLPLMPFALESFDLSSYDLVISSESGPAKGIIPAPDAVHICYCHSPMRYVWDHYHTYRANSGMVSRTLMPLFAPRLRQWDVSTSARVDVFVANSHHVQHRIAKYYRRSSKVVSPPVQVQNFLPAEGVGDFYLCAGQLVRYKRVDLAVEAFKLNGKKLVIVGEGEELARLKATATPNISFLGRVPFNRLKELLSQCRALVFPGEEDFGITPVEAMASGRPVIAYGRGGVLDTVLPNKTGVLFEEQSTEGLLQAIEYFEAMESQFEPLLIRQHAQQFSAEEFKGKIRTIVEVELDRRASQKAHNSASLTEYWAHEQFEGLSPGPNPALVQ